MNGTFRVLHVCTGNLCRSPLAEHLMRAGLAARLGEEADAFQLGSAGTHGYPGDPMEPYALQVLAERGVDGSAFRVRELAAELVGEADLVLTATRQHRLAVVGLDASAASRTFTLQELARLASEVDPDELPHGGAVARARALVPIVARRRRAAARPSSDDLSDPYRGPRKGFEACARAVDEALQVPLGLWSPAAE